MSPQARHILPRVYGTIWIATVVLFLAAPSNGIKGACFTGVCAVAGGGILAGRRLHRASVWWVSLGIGLLGIAVANAIWYLDQVLWHVGGSSVVVSANAFYFMGFLLCSVALMGLVRARNRRYFRANVIDACIVTANVGIVAWIFIMSPYLTADMSIQDRILTLAYPSGSLLVFAGFMALLFSGNRRGGAYAAMSVALTTLFVSDSIYYYASLHNGYVIGGVLDLGWLVAFGVLGGLALHPSMCSIEQPTADVIRSQRGRVVWFAASTLVGPGAMLIQMALGQEPNMIALRGGILIVFLLVLVRMGDLVGEGEKRADELSVKSAELEAALVENVESQRSLREAQARYQALVEQIPAVVYIDNLADDIANIYISPQIETLLGYTPEEWRRDKLWLKVLHADDRERVVEEHLRSNRDLDLFSCEYRVTARDERIVWVRDEAIVVRDEDGNPKFWQGVIVDMSAAKKAAEDRENLAAQLRQSQKMDAVGQLAGGIAHDFNNALAVIQSYAGFLVADLDDDDARKQDAEEIVRSGRRAERLVRQLLTFSRRDVAHPTIVRLNEIVVEVEKLLRRTLRGDIELAHDLASDSPPVLIDSGQIEQILLNLAVNAQDAMPNGGRLSIETCRLTLDSEFSSVFENLPAGDYACLRLSDTGIGMAPETTARIFEPFFTTKPQGAGTGLGLAMVYGIVKDAGGYVDVHSEVAAGSIFTVYLPACDAPGITAGDVDTTTPSARANGETVLVAEDEGAVREVVRRALANHGFTVLLAASGREALDIALENEDSIDILITDVVMPEMSGRELHEQLLARGFHVPTIFMSGYSNESLPSGDEDGSMCAYLAKPFTSDQLLTKLQEVTISA